MKRFWETGIIAALLVFILLATGIFTFVSAHGSDAKKIHVCVNTSNGIMVMVQANNDCSGFDGNWVPVHWDRVGNLLAIPADQPLTFSDNKADLRWDSGNNRFTTRLEDSKTTLTDVLSLSHETHASLESDIYYQGATFFSDSLPVQRLFSNANMEPGKSGFGILEEYLWNPDAVVTGEAQNPNIRRQRWWGPANDGTLVQYIETREYMRSRANNSFDGGWEILLAVDGSSTTVEELEAGIEINRNVGILLNGNNNGVFDLKLRQDSAIGVGTFLYADTSTGRLKITGENAPNPKDPLTRLHITESLVSGVSPDPTSVLLVEKAANSTLELKTTDNVFAQILFSSPNAQDKGAIRYHHANDFAPDPQNTLVLESAGDILLSPNSNTSVDGYLKLDLSIGTPPSDHCDEASERGRMKVDNASGLLYICVDSGWITK